MKFTVSIIITAIFAYALGLYFDWWSIAIAAFIVAVAIPQKPVLAWFSGFLGVFLMWSILAFIKTNANGNLLATKIAGVLPLGGNPYLVLIVAAFVGGLVAGFAALAGCYLRKSK